MDYNELFEDEDFSIQNTLSAINDILDSLDYDIDSDIRDVRKRYEDEKLIEVELNDQQKSYFSDFNNQLSEISIKNFTKLNPEEFTKQHYDEKYHIEQDINEFIRNYSKGMEKFYFSGPTSDGSIPLYYFKKRLQDFSDLLCWLIQIIDEHTKSTRINDKDNTINITIGLIEEKLEVIQEIISKQEKVIFSSKLDSLLKREGLKQNELARMLQVRPQTVSLWCNADSLPSIERAIQLAQILNTSVDYLVRKDVFESNLDNEVIYKTIGLNSKTSDKLRQLNKEGNYKAKELSDLINLLISNCGEDDTDIASALIDYFNLSENQEIYVVSDELLTSLNYEVGMECDSVEDAKKIVKRFVNTISNSVENKDMFGTSLSNLQLMDIQKILVKVKKGIDKEIYG